MTPTVKRILDQCKALGIVVLPTPDGQYLDLRYNDPPPEELRQLLKTHKSEIIGVLKPRKPLWHAVKIMQAVEKEGLCLFWDELLGEVVAFIKDESFHSKVPGSIVAYTRAEIEELHGEGKPKIPPETLKMIHEAKKAGGKVADYGSKDILEC